VSGVIQFLVVTGIISGSDIENENTLIFLVLHNNANGS
jgi:hypothetical protein